MKPSPEAAKILRAVKRLILAEPKRLHMADWGQRRSGPGAPACGTVGCIAGWTVLVSSGLASKWALKLLDNSAFNGLMAAAGIKAASILGYPTFDYTGGRLYKLFYPSSWPEPFRIDYHAAKTQTSRAKIVGKRIDHFIKTGE